MFFFFIAYNLGLREYILIYSMLMTKFGKCTKPFSSNKVRKIVSIKIVISIRQLVKHVKKSKLGGVCKFDLIAQISWMNCIK